MREANLPPASNCGIGLPLFVIFLSLSVCNLSSAAIESSSSSSSDYEHDFSDYQRRSLLPPPRNRISQPDLRIGTSSSKQDPQKTKARNRRDQSKDLKKLIQELEESDYSNYGSWGNFRQKQPVPKKSETTGSRRDDESDSMVYHGDSGRDEDLDNDNDNDYFEIQEHEDDDVDQDVYYRDRNSNGESTKSQSSIRSIPEPRAMLQKSIENVLYRNEEQNNPDVNSHALSLYHTDEYQRNRDLYESWLYQQSLVVVQPTAVAATELALTQLESAPMLELQSVLQAASVVIICAFLSYVSVSPRSLPLVQYNKAYKDGLLRVFCSLVWPSIILSQLSSPTVNINDIIGNFMKSFSLGYSSLVALEFMVVTAMRMIVLRLFDRQAFNLCPRIPAIFLPWKLSENHFFPKHVTLVLFSVLDSCLFSPIVEEGFKLFILKILLRKKMKKIISKKATVLPTGNVSENVPQALNILEEHSLKSYMVVMISISIGMKVADNIRRIVLYSHANQKHRMFFAIARSFFPVHELCGAMTALSYAKKEVLGHKSSYFQILFPSVLLHAMANFRGMKPFYVWKSSRPWDEVQLQAWNAIDTATPIEMAGKTALNLLWFTVLARTLSTIFKQYVQASREFLVQLKEKQLSGDIKEYNSPNDQEKPPATGTETEILSQTRTQSEHEASLQSNIVQGNHATDSCNGNNINRDLHELQNNEFDDYEFQDENNFESPRRNNLRNQNFQNYGRINNNNNNGDDDGDEGTEKERMSESYTKYKSQNNPPRRQGNHQQQQQQQHQQQQVMVRNNFNKNNHQNFRTTSPQRPLTEINLRNTKISRNPSEFDIVSQNDFTGYEGGSRERSGQYENRELDSSRSSSSSSSRNGQQYNQNIESNERIRSNQNHNLNPNLNINHNNKNLKNKNSK